jgi:hypothetical protein
MVAIVLGDALRFSVDKASVEMLYLPLPPAVKGPSKRFIDTAVDRVAGAIAGFLWLGLTWAFAIESPGRIGYASLLVFAVVAVWLTAIARARRGYREMYRRVLRAAAETPAMVAAREVSVEEVPWRAQLEALPSLDPAARGRTLRAIARAQRTAAIAPNAAPLSVAPSEIDHVLEVEAATLGRLARARDGLRGGSARIDSPQTHEAALALLRTSVDEAIRATLERIERAMALSFSREDVHAAFVGLRDESAPRRAAALELLDAMMDGASSRAHLVAALERVTLSPRPIGMRITASRARVLAKLVEGNDAWLRELAVHVAELSGHLRAPRANPSKSARATALAAGLVALRPAERPI